MRLSIFALFASTLAVLAGCSGTSPKADASTDALKEAGGDRDASPNNDGAGDAANESGGDGSMAEAGGDSAIDASPEATVDAPVDAVVDSPVDSAVDAPVDAPDDGTAADVVDAAVDPAIDPLVDAVVDAAIEAPLTYTLRVENYIAWCKVSVQSGSFTSVSTETFTFPAGTVVDLSGDTVSSASFFWSYWFGTDGDTTPAHDTSMMTTVTMDMDKVVQACCPVNPPPGTPCPAP